MEVAIECSPPSSLAIPNPLALAIPNHLHDQQYQEQAFDPRFLHLKILTSLLSCWIFHFQLSCGPGQTPATDGCINNVNMFKHCVDFVNYLNVKTDLDEFHGADDFLALFSLGKLSDGGFTAAESRIGSNGLSWVVNNLDIMI